MKVSKITQTDGKDSVQNKQICFLIDDDIAIKLRNIQAKHITKNQESVSFSQIINYVIRKSLQK